MHLVPLSSSCSSHWERRIPKVKKDDSCPEACHDRARKDGQAKNGMENENPDGNSQPEVKEVRVPTVGEASPVQKGK